MYPPRSNSQPSSSLLLALTQHTTLTNPVGVMLGCCRAQRAVQWSLLTYITCSRSAWLTRASIALSFSLAYSPPHTPNKLVGVMLGCCMAWRAVQWSLLTYITCSRSAWLTRASIALSFSLAYSPPHTPNKLVGVMLGCCMAWRAVQWSLLTYITCSRFAWLTRASIALSFSLAYSPPHTPNKLVGVMLGCCMAWRAVQWSLLTYITCSRSAWLTRASIALSFSLAYSPPHTPNKLVGVMLGCCMAWRAVQWSLLTYITCSRSAWLTRASIALSFSLAYSPPHTPNKLVGVVLGCCMAWRAVQWSL